MSAEMRTIAPFTRPVNWQKPHWQKLLGRNYLDTEQFHRSNQPLTPEKSLLDYMLFMNEAPLTSRVRGASGFAETFAAVGLRDSKGRSLRDLDLERRLLRYPCSYMIYSEAFEALPPRAKNAVYDRLWDVLSGKTTDKTYAGLTTVDRLAIIEILLDTKKDLPPSWGR